MLIHLAVASQLLGDEGSVFSYADISISRRLNLRPQSRVVSDTEAAGNELLAELRKANARIVTNETSAIVEIQFSELDTNALSDGAIREFRKLTSLRCLSIRAPQLIRQLLPELSSLPMLEELSLCTRRLSSDMIQSLNKAPALSRLRFEDLRLDRDAATAIAQLAHLNSLHFDGCSFPVGIDAAFVAIPRLKSLWISGGLNDGPHKLKGLESLPGLQCLWIDSIWCNQEAMQRIGGLTQLEELSLQYVGLNDQMLQELRSLTKMRRVLLGNATDFTGDGLRYLGDWRALEELSVFSTSFEDDAARTLEQFPSLKKFVAHDTFLTDTSVDSLMKLEKLKLAWISKTKISPAGIEQLKNRLPECQVR